MAALKSQEADDVFHYFCTQEPDFIKETYKVFNDQVLPIGRDYFVYDNNAGDVYLETDD